MKATHFDLQGVDGKRHSPASARGKNGLVVMFICNHCPYVKRSLERILRDSRELAKQGIGSIAIMPNDPGYNAEDSFANMQRIAKEKAFPFPYVIDESQDVARAYDAVCTPDFYAFDADLELCYHGRLEDLVPAMTGTPPAKPVNSIGCSIKWKK
jgi:peroxiredoxin